MMRQERNKLKAKSKKLVTSSVVEKWAIEIFELRFKNYLNNEFVVMSYK